MSCHGLSDGFPNAAQQAILGHLRSGAMTSPGLAIKAAGSPDAQAGAFAYGIDGRCYSKAAQATLSLSGLGTIAAGGRRTAFLTVTAGGVVGLIAVSPDANGVTTLPEPAKDACLWGAVTVANGSSAAYVAGTTALDAAGLTVSWLGLSGVVPGEAL